MRLAIGSSQKTISCIFLVPFTKSKKSSDKQALSNLRPGLILTLIWSRPMIELISPTQAQIQDILFEIGSAPGASCLTIPYGLKYQAGV